MFEPRDAFNNKRHHNGGYPKQPIIVMNLPFVKERQIPIRRKMAGESRYGFSEDDDLIERSLDELMAAREAKDHAGFMDALKALIECLMNKEGEDARSDEKA